MPPTCYAWRDKFASTLPAVSDLDKASAAAFRCPASASHCYAFESKRRYHEALQARRDAGGAAMRPTALRLAPQTVSSPVSRPRPHSAPDASTSPGKERSSPSAAVFTTTTSNSSPLKRPASASATSSSPRKLPASASASRDYQSRTSYRQHLADVLREYPSVASKSAEQPQQQQQPPRVLLPAVSPTTTREPCVDAWQGRKGKARSWSDQQLERQQERTWQRQWQERQWERQREWQRQQLPHGPHGFIRTSFIGSWMMAPMGAARSALSPPPPRRTPPPRPRR